MELVNLHQEIILVALSEYTRKIVKLGAFMLHEKMT